MTLTVLGTGARTLVQDLGRPGQAARGVGRSGAADRAALRLANRLVGNDEHAAGLEVLLGGLVVRADRLLTVCVTGALAPGRVDGRPVGHASTVRLRPGQVLVLDLPAAGARSYLGVRGGVQVEPVLGSRSTDTLSGLGPPAVHAGQVLPVGPSDRPLPDADHAPWARPSAAVLRMLPGPRTGWLRGTLEGTWTAAADSDRIGVRLQGPRVARRVGELPPEALLPGAVQLPPDGQPVLFLADAPVTGGYPVVAVLPPRDTDRAAQLRPGEQLRLHWAAPARVGNRHG